MYELERFLSKIRYEELDSNLGPCWIWTAGKISNGYAQFWDGNGYTYGHNWAFQFIRGEIIDPTMDRDHLCRQPACVNPWHLEQVAHRTNILRGNGAAALNARKSVCKYGHNLLDPLNVILIKNNWRRCRTCNKRNRQKYKRVK